jgi:hypothetical protein
VVRQNRESWRCEHGPSDTEATYYSVMIDGLCAAETVLLGTLYVHAPCVLLQCTICIDSDSDCDSELPVLSIYPKLYVGSYVRVTERNVMS